MALGAGDKAIIRQMVDRLHVGVGAGEVEKAVLRGMTHRPEEKLFRQILAYAMKVHRDNRALYGDVMGGRINTSRSRRRNPELARGSTEIEGPSHDDVEYGRGRRAGEAILRDQNKLRRWLIKYQNTPSGLRQKNWYEKGVADVIGEGMEARGSL